MNYNLQDIKLQLDKLREKEVIDKSCITQKIEKCYFAAHARLSGSNNFTETEVQSDLSYIGGLLEQYSKETEYLTKTHMIQLNKLYRKYK